MAYFAKNSWSFRLLLGGKVFIHWSEHTGFWAFGWGLIFRRGDAIIGRVRSEVEEIFLAVSVFGCFEIIMMLGTGGHIVEREGVFG